MTTTSTDHADEAARGWRLQWAARYTVPPDQLGRCVNVESVIARFGGAAVRPIIDGYLTADDLAREVIEDFAALPGASGRQMYQQALDHGSPGRQCLRPSEGDDSLDCRGGRSRRHGSFQRGLQAHGRQLADIYLSLDPGADEECRRLVRQLIELATQEGDGSLDVFPAFVTKLFPPLRLRKLLYGFTRSWAGEQIADQLGVPNTWHEFRPTSRNRSWARSRLAGVSVG